MDYLQNMYGANQLQPLPNWPPNILDTIAAQFADDDAWYRGVVLRLQANKAEVGSLIEAWYRGVVVRLQANKAEVR